jgi:hypothetical protein
MRRLFPLAILLLASCAQVGPRLFPERKTQQVGAFTIEYSAGDEAYADVLADLLRKPKLNLWSVKTTPLGLKVSSGDVTILWVVSRRIWDRHTHRH